MEYAAVSYTDMKLKVNGREEILTSHNNPVPTILDLITIKGLTPQNMVIELDGEVVPREDWAHAILREGSNVELLRFVGGG